MEKLGFRKIPLELAFGILGHLPHAKLLEIWHAVKFGELFKGRINAIVDHFVSVFGLSHQLVKNANKSFAAWSRLMSALFITTEQNMYSQPWMVVDAFSLEISQRFFKHNVPFITGFLCLENKLLISECVEWREFISHGALWVDLDFVQVKITTVQQLLSALDAYQIPAAAFQKTHNRMPFALHLDFSISLDSFQCNLLASHKGFEFPCQRMRCILLDMGQFNIAPTLRQLDPASLCPRFAKEIEI